MSEGHHRDSATIRCRNCADRVEACDGEHGEWMHSATRQEACAGGLTHADAEDYGDIVRREGRDLAMRRATGRRR